MRHETRRGFKTKDKAVLRLCMSGRIIGFGSRMIGLPLSNTCMHEARGTLAGAAHDQDLCIFVSLKSTIFCLRAC